VFLFQHARGKRSGVSPGSDRHPRLAQDRAVVRAAVTSCTVQPASVSPAASARAWVSSPGISAGARGGCSASARPGPTNPGRQDPHEARKADDVGRAASSSFCISAASNAATVAPKGRWSTAAAGTPQRARLVQPARVRGSFDSTSTGPRRVVARHALDQRTMFDPPPEIRIATRFTKRAAVAHARARRDRPMRTTVSPASRQRGLKHPRRGIGRHDERPCRSRS
jgi:hypothetical protein